MKLGTYEVVDMPVQQLMALVLLYSSGFPTEPESQKLPKTVVTKMKQENLK